MNTIERIRLFGLSYSAGLAFMLLAFTGGWAIDHAAKNEAISLYRSQLSSCYRGQLDRQDAIGVDQAVLEAFRATDRRTKYANVTPERVASESRLQDAIYDYKTRTTKYNPDYACKKVIKEP